MINTVINTRLFILTESHNYSVSCSVSLKCLGTSMWSPARFEMAVTETPPSQGPGGGSSGRKAVRGIVLLLIWGLVGSPFTSRAIDV